MNKITQLFFGCAAALFFYSCEGGTTFTKTINNTSSETLTVTLHTTFETFSPTTISPNEQKEIYFDDYTGLFVGDAYSCTSDFDSVTVSVSNGKILLMDLTDENNWTKISKDGRNSREDCTATISDSDLQ